MFLLINPFINKILVGCKRIHSLSLSFLFISLILVASSGKSIEEVM